MTTATIASANLALPTVSLERHFPSLSYKHVEGRGGGWESLRQKVPDLVEKPPVLAAPTVVTEAALWFHFAPPPQ